MTTSDGVHEESVQKIDAVHERHSDAARVLFVDDNSTVRESAQHYLQKAGYSVTLASSGFEALAKVVENPPDVVLANITMPGLDGYQICALMKSNSDYRHIPVIMLTGRDGLSDTSRSELVGSNAYISKPFTAQALAAAVREVSQVQKGTDL